jgi:hypothetical protein
VQIERQDPDSTIIRNADLNPLPFFILLSDTMGIGLGGLGTLKKFSDFWSAVLQLLGK